MKVVFFDYFLAKYLLVFAKGCINILNYVVKIHDILDEDVKRGWLTDSVCLSVMLLFRKEKILVLTFHCYLCFIKYLDYYKRRSAWTKTAKIIS